MNRIIVGLLLSLALASALADELPATPQGLADHLNGILNSDMPAWQINDAYEDVWADIPDDVREQIKEIWAREEEARWEAQQAEWERERVEELKNAGEDWANQVADFFVTTAVSERSGTGGATIYQQAGQDIVEAREFYGPQIQALGTDARNLQTQLQQEITRRDTFQDNLDSHLEDQSVWASLDFTEDRRETYLEGQVQAAEERIASLRGQLATTVETLEGLNRQLEGYENAVVLEAVKKDEALLAAEEERRFDELVELNQELATKRAQFTAGYDAYQEQFASLDAAIEEAKKKAEENDDYDELVDRLETQRENLQNTFDLWLNGMQVTIEARGKDIHRAEERNRADGIGPVNGNQLAQQATEQGLNLHEIFHGADRQRVEAAQTSAGQQAAGAAGEEVPQYTAWDFAKDYSDGVAETFSSWDNFSGRFGATYGGMGVAAKDAVVDIFVLAGEGVDTVWEYEQVALNYYTGQNVDAFGHENIDFLSNLYEGTTGGNYSENVYTATQGVINWADRRFEQHAGSGEKGLRDALYDTGYVVGTVAGLEEAPITIFLKGSRFLRVAGKLEDVADVGTDVSNVADLATDAARLDNAVPDGTFIDDITVYDDVVLPPPGRALGPLDPDSTLIVPQNGMAVPYNYAEDGTLILNNGNEVPGVAPQLNNPPPGVGPVPPGHAALPMVPPGPRSPNMPRGPPAEGLPPGHTITDIARDGERITLTRSDGSTVTGTRLGKPGSTSTAYALDDPRFGHLIIKVTKPLEDAGSAAAGALDNYGYEVLNGLPDGVVDVPRTHAQYPVKAPDGDLAGGTVSVMDRAPTNFRDAKHIQTPAGDMTPGQLDAYNRFMDALHETKHAWADNKWDNYAFRRVGGPESDTWIMVVFDPGGIVPFKTVDDARAFQRAIDNPGPEVLADDWEIVNPRFGVLPVSRQTLMDDLATRFDDAADWQRLNQGAGTDFETFGYANGADGANLLPYNPSNGYNLPNLRDNVAARNAAEAVAPAAIAGDSLIPPGCGFNPEAPTWLGSGGLVPAFPMNGGAPPDFALPETQLFPPGEGVLPLPKTPDDVPIIPGADQPMGCSAGVLPVNRACGMVWTSEGGLFGNRHLADAFGGTSPDSWINYAGRRVGFGACNASVQSGCDGAPEMYVLDCPYGREDQVLQLAANDPSVLFFEMNPYRDEQALPNDPFLYSKGSWGQKEADTWGLAAIGFDAANDSAWHALNKGGEPVTVAVIDSGLAWSHPDFDTGALWYNDDEIPDNRVDDDGNGYVDDIVGWNFVNANNIPWDLNGHGTLVAGVIGATRDNGLGVSGINPAARIMVLKAVDMRGKTRASYLTEAVIYAADNGARVINLSVGGRTLTRSEQTAIDYARGKGAVVVAAAGNEAIDITDYGPGGNDGVITVTAVDPNRERHPAANVGRPVDIAAPGVDILGLRAMGSDMMALVQATDPGALPDYTPGDNIVGPRDWYFRATGTSFAAPMVSGVAALILSNRPELNNVQVERMLRQSAGDIDTPGVDTSTGYGMLNAKAALAAEPEYYVDARIDGVQVVMKNGQPWLQVNGIADADEFDRSWIEIGAGENPRKWKRVGEQQRKATENGEVGAFEAKHLSGSKQWTVRLVVEHRDGSRREARLAVNLG